MRIAVFEIEDWERKAFEGLKDGHDVQFVEGPLNAESAGRFEDCEIVSTFIYSDLDDAVLKQLDRLKMISTRSTGYDHIDLQVCKDKKIAVCNVPEYGENTVAEHVFGLLLTVSHHLYEAIDRTRKGDFSLQGLRGFDLRGKTLGVIGTGSIGRCVIGIARGFGMEVLAFDLKPDRELERQGVRYASMDDLLAGSDVITLHLPGGEKTRNLICEGGGPGHLLLDSRFRPPGRDRGQVCLPFRPTEVSGERRNRIRIGVKRRIAAEESRKGRE